MNEGVFDVLNATGSLPPVSNRTRFTLAITGSGWRWWNSPTISVLQFMKNYEAEISFTVYRYIKKEFKS